MRLSLDECLRRYGTPKDGVWAEEAKHCTFLIPVDGLGWTNTATGKPVEHIYCNNDMALPLHRALENIVTRGLWYQLFTFDGCLMIRDVRGVPGQISTHALALAIDINAATNKLGTPGDMSPELAKCFTDEGFTHGRSFKRQDPMHFSYAWE